MVKTAKRRQPIKTPQLFCRQHQHGQTIANLIDDYGCADNQELEVLLNGALRWAETNLVRFYEGIGDAGLAREEHSGRHIVCVGRLSFDIVADDASWACPVYRHLLKAALALTLRSHPVVRRSIETQFAARRWVEPCQLRSAGLSDEPAFIGRALD
jgi:hypothetical protein